MILPEDRTKWWSELLAHCAIPRRISYLLEIGKSDASASPIYAISSSETGTFGGSATVSLGPRELERLLPARSAAQRI